MDVQDKEMTCKSNLSLNITDMEVETLEEAQEQQGEEAISEEPKNLMDDENDTIVKSSSNIALNSGESNNHYTNTDEEQQQPVGELASTSKPKVAMKIQRKDIALKEVQRIILPRKSKTKAYESLKKIARGIPLTRSGLRDAKKFKRKRLGRQRWVKKRKPKKAAESRKKNRYTKSVTSVRESGFNILSTCTSATSETCKSDDCPHCGGELVCEKVINS